MTLVERGTVLSRISWTGVFAGLAVGLVTQIALSALGLAFGAGADSVRGLAIGTVLWLAVSLAISSFLAGLTAARAAGYLTPAQGRFNGLVTGSLLALLTTLLLGNALTSGYRAASNAVGSLVNAGAAATSAAAESGAATGAVQSDPVQAILGGLDEQEIGQIIAEGAPELNAEQGAAAARVVSGIIRRASNDLGDNLNDLTNLGQIATRRVEAISGALSGPEFVTRLQRQGLTQAQAQETAQAINTRVTELRQQAEQTAATAERLARQAATTAAWGSLLALGLILGLATLGGGRGADLPKRGAEVEGSTIRAQS